MEYSTYLLVEELNSWKCSEEIPPTASLGFAVDIVIALLFLVVFVMASYFFINKEDK